MTVANLAPLPFPGFAVFDQYVATVIGLAVPHMRFALNEQGLVSFEDLLALTENDIDQIANAICKPGGVIPNPAFNPNFPVPGVLPTLPNPGPRAPIWTSSCRTVEALMLLCFPSPSHSM
jgi:hypothetical protein